MNTNKKTCCSFPLSAKSAPSAVCISFVTALTLATLQATTARAENVDLSTVPSRDTVQLTIYNSEDLTLVRETRVVSFKKGLNPLQFSWANTQIDPSSVELRILKPADKLELLDTTFPHDKPQMLYWNVQSEFDGEATIQITYFTSGITCMRFWRLVFLSSVYLIMRRPPSGEWRSRRSRIRASCDVEGKYDARAAGYE